MATFVLVHGAGHGGWAWQRVTPLLEAAGHRVYTPTLTGLGERRHFASPTVSLTTHIDDVLGVLTYEDLHDVVLVGHSYAGMVIAGVYDRAPERIRHLVYFDSVIPEDGESMNDITDPGTVAVMERRAARQGEGWLLPPAPASRYGITDPDDVRWVEERLVPQPYPPFKDKLRLTKPVTVPRTYISCTAKELSGPASNVRGRQPGWTWREIATGHDAMMTMPQETAALLLEAADER